MRKFIQSTVGDVESGEHTLAEAVHSPLSVHVLISLLESNWMPNPFERFQHPNGTARQAYCEEWIL